MVELDASGGKFSAEVVFPGTTWIDFYIHKSVNVGGLFYSRFDQHGDSIAPQGSEEEAKFENDVLARTRLAGCAPQPAFVVRSQQDDGVRCPLCVLFELLQESASRVRLLVQNDNFPSGASLKSTNGGRQNSVISPVHHEDRTV